MLHRPRKEGQSRSVHEYIKQSVVQAVYYHPPHPSLHYWFGLVESRGLVLVVIVVGVVVGVVAVVVVVVVEVIVIAVVVAMAIALLVVVK